MGPRQDGGCQLQCAGMLSFLSQAVTKEAQGTPHSISSAVFGAGEEIKLLCCKRKGGPRQC